MKLVIGGSTGFVGTELVRQALIHPAISAVVALGRRETPLPQGIDEASVSSKKLKSIICDDFETYSDTVKSELRDVDACIWTIAITPSKHHTLPFEDVCKISRDYAITAVKTLATTTSSAREEPDRPFRFVYISGIGAKRDRAEAEKDQMLVERGMVEYSLVRGDAESQILAFAAKSHGRVEAAAARPGLILSPEREARTIPGIPSIDVHVLAASLLDQVLKGFEKDTLMHDDLVRLGKGAIFQQQQQHQQQQ